jgi:hypothetical protein
MRIFFLSEFPSSRQRVHIKNVLLFILEIYMDLLYIQYSFMNIYVVQYTDILSITNYIREKQIFIFVHKT